ncbi:MAG: acyl-CoA dehydratase activase [bacterium]|nr:acyl-CoA dehydratase activase [bacterium]
MITIGIDIGSNTSKGIILRDGKIVAETIFHTAFKETDRGKLVLQKLFKLSSLKKKDINYIVATGYGRVNVPFADKTVTEITCHAKGMYHLLPKIRTIIDIGGQDCKIIILDNDGIVLDFNMNDRCSAGTGKFFEVTAHALGLKLHDLSALYCRSKAPCSINSTCTVFAETEIISLLSEKYKRKDIVAGLIQTMAKRIVNSAKGLKIKPYIAFTGGVAKNEAMRTALEKELGQKFAEFDFDPQLVGALGAALLAAKALK